MAQEEILTPSSLGGLRLYQAADIELPERVMIYGEATVGKTPLVASANLVSAFSPILIINVDRGAKSLKNLHPGVTIVNVRTFQALYNVFKELHQRKGAGFKSVCVDGATTAQFKGFEHLLNEGKINTDFIDFKSPSGVQDWTSSIQQMTILFNAFNELPIHVFFTAWARNIAKPKKMMEVPPPVWVPDFTPGVLNIAAGAFDTILYMNLQTQTAGSSKKTVRVLQSKGTDSVMARDRGDRLPGSIVDPTMEVLAKHWGLDHTLVGQGS